MAPFNDKPPKQPFNDRKTLTNDVKEIDAKAMLPNAQERQQWQQKKNDVNKDYRK